MSATSSVVICLWQEPPLYLLLFAVLFTLWWTSSYLVPCSTLPGPESRLSPSTPPFRMEVPRSSGQPSPRRWVARQSNVGTEAIDEGLSHRCGRVRTLLRPTKERLPPQTQWNLSPIYGLGDTAYFFPSRQGFSV